jgi:predicted RNase H-like HicB family nuclease
MQYPVQAIKNSNEKGYKFSVIDLPGCQIKALTMDEGLAKLNEAMAAHLSVLVEYGEQVPPAKSIEEHMQISNQPTAIWALLEFDIIPYLGKSHKINVTLPELLIKKIDDRVAKSAQYSTRSGFIANACIAELAK